MADRRHHPHAARQDPKAFGTSGSHSVRLHPRYRRSDRELRERPVPDRDSETLAVSYRVWHRRRWPLEGPAASWARISKTEGVGKPGRFGVGIMNAVCRVCQSLAGPFGEARVLGGHSVRYFRCGSCGFVKTEPPHWLAEAYQDALSGLD